MKSHKCRIIAFLCLGALLLAGCSKETNSGPGAMGSEIWTEMPALTYGTLESEKLAVLPWNSGRCEATSNNLAAETEKGYYWLVDSFLKYAEKDDLGNWIPVCSQPNCYHGITSACDALTSSSSFLIRNGRIFSVEPSYSHQELYQGNARGSLLISRALDGSDKQLAYLIEDAMMSSEGGNSSAFLTSEYWLYNIMELNKDGSYTGRSYRVTEEGTEQLFSETVADTSSSLVGPASDIRGGGLFVNFLWGDGFSTFYRFEGSTLVECDLSEHAECGEYLSGNILRCFRKNDGYYDVNLETGEETRIANARLKNSGCTMLLANCVIESTLDYSVKADHAQVVIHEMQLFDGEKWRAVTLPEEFLSPEQDLTLAARAVASNCIFFTSYQENICKLYCIFLGTDELRLEYCGQISSR